MNEKVFARVENCAIKVVERTAKSGKPYSVVVAVVNGKDVQLGFVNAYTELALVKAGVKFSY